MIVFIGFDARDYLGYVATVRSLRAHAINRFLKIVPLCDWKLRSAGYFRRPHLMEGGGQRIDGIDGRPYSTEFAFTRFLAGALAGMAGEKVALFCDADFLFRADVGELMRQPWQDYAVMCVQHEHVPPEGVKEVGVQVSNGPYDRKNWSSLMLWNVEHEANGRLTLDDVNTRPGKWLHGLQWLDDSEIGALPPQWNYLVNQSAPLATGDPAAVHFTEGLPNEPGHENDEFADEWRRYVARLEIEV